MSVKELMEVLSKLDQNSDVMIWNCEWDHSRHIDEVEVNQDGEVVLY